MTFNSIAMQSYENIEVIVVDGGSTDDTCEVVKSFSDLVDVFVSEPDNGIYDALNKGLRLASGDVVAILHSNDVFAVSTVLEDVAASFLQNSDLSIFLSGVNFVSDDGRQVLREYTASGFTPWMFYFGLMPPHTGSFFRSRVYAQVGFFNTSYTIAGDFDFFVRAMLIERLTYSISPLVSVSMSVGGVSTSGLKSYLAITQEFSRSLSDNGLFSSRVLLFVRAFFKLSQFRLRYFIRHKGNPPESN